MNIITIEGKRSQSGIPNFVNDICEYRTAWACNWHP